MTYLCGGWKRVLNIAVILPYSIYYKEKAISYVTYQLFIERNKNAFLFKETTKNMSIIH